MALIVDQQPPFKHFCKICKKGFVCGRALGGHMRAHGIGDEISHIEDDDDVTGEWDEKIPGNVVPSINKRPMYALRTNPNRLKTCRVCENCGKEFLSWKSFLEHGKCTSDDADSLISSPHSDGDIDIDIDGRQGNGWFKRKRSLRVKVENFNPNCPSSEEEDLANCLMMLSNANPADHFSGEQEESCASASKEEDRRNSMNDRRNPVNYLSQISSKIPQETNKSKSVASKGIFECKACRKVFNSHQALGGHRASHKKVKGCFAAKLDQIEDSQENDDVLTHEDHHFIFSTKASSTLQFYNGGTSNSNPPVMASSSKKRSKIHECSICHRIFTSGQALGGHKRCHWITSTAPENSSLAKIHNLQDQIEPINSTHNAAAPLDLKLDLNLPAPREDRTSNPANLKVSASIYLQSWINGKEKEEDDIKYHHCHLQQTNEDEKDENDNGDGVIQKIDDEAESKVKLAKLSELKDMNINGGSSPWLQMGIGSTTDVGANP